ncbi:hypothetical protein A5647_24080 [Mycobacterium sp. 1100029.7]|nr:hypothetical protein A5647_24080 [Mycobacterium sp. 1100029.7]
MAIGVLMGMRRCSPHDALETLVSATRTTGIGLGGVSRALLDVISGDSRPSSVATAHWQALIEPAHPENG